MIYFDNEKNAYGYEIENPICTITDEQWKDYAGTDKWDIINGVFTDITNTPEYIEKKKQEEAERVGNLKCTKRVLVLMLKELQYSWKDVIKPLIYADDDASLEWELCVELQRKNPLLDAIGGQLGIEPEQIDNLFKYANGEITQQEFLGE